MENANLLWSKLTKRFASSTFNNQACIWIRFCRINYNGNLQSFISKIRQCLNEVISIKVKVGTTTLAFTILTKVPDEYHNVVEKVTTNTETLGNPNSILNLLHNVAFLNAPLEEDLTLTIPDGRNKDRGRKVLRLYKAIYRLKQAPLAWYNHLASWLKKALFKCSVADPCVFYRIESKPVWIYVHVDDLEILGPDLTWFKQEIQNAFDTKDLGKAELLLGVKVKHLTKGFLPSQEHYIDKLAEEYEIKSLNPSKAPLKPKIQLSNATEDEVRVFKKLKITYQGAIGALNYISLDSRPDIAFAVSHLSQFLENTGITHWTACVQVLQYLYHTKTLALLGCKLKDVVFHQQH
ncbi:hypothetical protein O181_059345 [Austropuccinia psidii MF-1]|uniref:Reverse transcriptase Ty1/copia-type domain-containing protein n=1 Tax=Austropuccinia psidii MF-1 TaxID=1389203 RepID=A0A9Q3EBA1_9BASI|nr:hypothetical protein [Austropuccinia psidii MF-1]